MTPGSTVTVAGDRDLTVADTPETRDRFGWETREATIRCHSGRVIEGTWSGVPVAPLLDAAGAPPDTTHLLVTARDGYRACVPVRRALDGLLGFAVEAVDDGREDGGSGDGHGGTAVTPRLLAPDLDSTRSVRGVDTVEPVAVPPDEDPRRRETVG